jgi:DNA transformation protein
MSRDEGFAEYITEDILGHIPGITRKALFGGYGIYLDKKIVGIIIDGTFYIKVDRKLIENYKKEGNEPFCYERPDGKVVMMSYVSVPLEILEDREKISDRIYEAFDLHNK